MEQQLQIYTIIHWIAQSRLAGHDLFHRNGQDVLVHFGELTLWQHRTNETRYAEVTVRYHFNWTRSKYKGTGAGNQEKNRL